MSDADMKYIALVITTASPGVLPFISYKRYVPQISLARVICSTRESPFSNGAVTQAKLIWA